MKLRKWYRLNRDKAIIFPLATHRKSHRKCISLSGWQTKQNRLYYYEISNRKKSVEKSKENNKSRPRENSYKFKDAIAKKYLAFVSDFDIFFPPPLVVSRPSSKLAIHLNHFIFAAVMSSSFRHGGALLHFHAATSKVGNKWGKWYKHEFCGYSSS